MPLFYQRVETQDEIIISYKNWVPYTLLSLGILSLLFYLLGRNLSGPFTWAFAIFFTIVFIDTWKPNREVRRANIDDGVNIEGSYFSFRGSINVTIKKEV